MDSPTGPPSPLPASYLVALAVVALLLVILALLAALLLTGEAVDNVGRRVGPGRIVHYGGSQFVYETVARETSAALAVCDLRYTLTIRRSTDSPQQIADYYAAHFRALGWSPLEGERSRYRVDAAAQVAYLTEVPPQIGDVPIPLNARTARSPVEVVYAVVFSTWDAAACPGL